MKIRFSILALALLGAQAQAAALDRSGQDTSAILQDGTYADLTYTYIDAKVSGKDTKGQDTKDIIRPYQSWRYSVKTEVNDNIGVAFVYDEPFGALTQYGDGNNFAGNTADASSAIINGLIGQTAKARIDALDNRDFGAGKGLAGLNALAQKQTKEDDKDALEALALSLQTSRTLLEGLQKNPSPEALDNLNKLAKGAAAQYDLLLQSYGSVVSPPVKALIEGFKTQAVQSLVESEKTLTALKITASSAQANKNLRTNVDVKVQNLSMLGDVKFNAPFDGKFHLFGGAAAQRLQGDVALAGIAYSATTGYKMHIPANNALGYVAGIAYSKPDIALKAALTYRSPIKHDAQANEELPFATLVGRAPASTEKITISTPASINIDLQSGINPTTLVTAKVRYVPWKNFSITPPAYHALTKRATPDGLALVSYNKDQWQAEIGVGKRIQPNLALSANVGYDSGAGNPTTTLGPVNGYYSLGLGARYNFTKEWSVSAGGKYLWMGDAKAQLPNGTAVGDFKDNNGYAVGVKLAYQGK